MSRGYLGDALRRKVHEAAHDRCGYCLSDQRYLLAPLEIEHIVPLSRGGTDEESNLWLSCPRCNRYKGAQVQDLDPVTGQGQKLFHPRHDAWNDHFRWSEEGTTVIGLTAVGRATVEALRLNHPHALAVRRNWVAAGWHPP